MSGYVESVLGLFFSVAGLTAVVSVVLIAWWRGRPVNAPGKVLTTLALVLLITSIPAIPLFFVSVYTSKYRPFARQDLPNAKVVVLLGAGTIATSGREHQFVTLNPVSASRVLEAARIYGLLDRPLIVSSGGTRSADATMSSAWVMRSALEALGVPSGRVRLEDRSFTTEDEARLIAPLLRELGSPSFVLVTSASHMPRSEAAFRAQGATPVPGVATDSSDSDQLRRWLPSVEGWRLTRAVLHEWLGFAYYRARGWTQ